MVQVQLFPYAYAYVAPQAVAMGAVPSGDYWRVSYRELLPQVPSDEFVVCYPDASEQGDTLRTLPATGRPLAESSADCRFDPAGNLMPYHLGDSDADRYDVSPTFVGLFSRGATPGANCREQGSVERWRYFSHVVLSTVATCDLVLERYPDAGVTFSSDGTGAEYLLGGWTADPTRPGVRLREARGSFGFEMPEGWTGQALQVELEGEFGDGTQLWVNNTPVEPSVRRPDSIVAEVDASVAGGLGENRLVVSLAPDEVGGELVLTQVNIHP